MKLKFKKDHYLPHQWKFLTSNKKIKALVAGFGSGKTHIFIRETFKHYINNKNPKSGKSNGWIIYPTYALADELFVDPFLELLDSKGIKYKYNIAKRTIKSKYGTIRIYQLQKPQRMVGSELTFIGFDEFDIESVKNCNMAYKKGLSRMRGCTTPCMFIVTTPEGFHETYRIFVKEANNEKIIVHARTLDNPYLPEGYVDTLLEEYDPKLLEGYLEGKFVNLTQGSIYYAFDRKNHVASTALPFDPTLPLCIAIDFNVSPMCWNIAQIKNKDDIRFIGEIVQKNTNTWAMCAELKERFAANAKSIDLHIYGDAAGQSRDTRGNETDYTIIDQELRGYFKSITYHVPAANPPIRTRYAEVNSRLAHQAIRIDPSCTWLIEDLEQVTYKPDGSGNPDSTNKDRTHSSDGAGYLIHVVAPITTRREENIVIRMK